MNAIWSALANAFLASLLIAAAIWICLRVTPRYVLSGAARYAIWWVALLATLLLPLAHLPRYPKTQQSARVERPTTFEPLLPMAPSPSAAHLIEMQSQRRRPIPIDIPATRWPV